jgi:hypothetical protein
MISLGKLLHYISRLKNRDFRKQVQEEKKQKYLFEEKKQDSFFTSRNGLSLWKKQKLLPFTRLFTSSFSFFDRHLLESKILSILGIILLSLSTYITFFSPYFELNPGDVLIESLTP